MPEGLQAMMPGQVPVSYYLILSAVLFSIGVAAFLLRKNVITQFMAIELMLNAVNLTFVAFTRSQATLALMNHKVPSIDGHIFVFFVMVVAAAEAAVGLAIIIILFRTRQTLNTDKVNLLKL